LFADDLAGFRRVAQEAHGANYYALSRLAGEGYSDVDNGIAGEACGLAKVPSPIILPDSFRAALPSPALGGLARERERA